MKLVRHLWPLLVALMLMYMFHRSWGVIPPLGKLFNPFVGFLQNAEQGSGIRDGEIVLAGLRGAVTVWYDDNAVPHIFAQNDDDLYFAQGYVIAKDRLWQMEFYSLVAAGRLTEVVGPGALEYDRYNRRIGMARTAANITEKLKNDTVANRILTAYAAGVNAYIDQLAARDLPVEYKLLNYKPERWSPYKSILMLMNMRHTLSGGSYDYRLTNVLTEYGPDVMADLFPDYPAIESPIVPQGTPWAFSPLAVPAAPNVVAAPPDTTLLAFHVPEPRPEVGSNNWAVGGRKSATGLPILANDPHLQLTLPSIWYQMQLSSPNENVYGVALPGTPAIIIGFNKDVAWGVTNTGSDVMDFYRIRFRDATLRTYWHDGQWKPTTRYIETYRMKDGSKVLDTLYYTHQGPIVYHEKRSTNYSSNIPVGYAMRWIANETDGADLLTFHYLNRATDYEDYREALTYFTAPAQNFVFSSNGGDIAIVSNGKLPLKWKEQGKYLLDGTLGAHDWQGWIPREQNPGVKNPPRGFVSSANQFPADTTYPYYLDWRFAHSSRAIRINERLDAMMHATADSLRVLQNDNYNVDARRILPRLLTSLALNDSIRQSAEYAALARWNYRNDADAVGASIFENWLDDLLRGIWGDEFPAEKRLLYPSLDRTFELINNEPGAKWFDRVDTPDTIETIDDIVHGSFKTAMAKLRERFGELSARTWAWANVKQTRIAHLVPNFTSFGRKNILNGGGSGVVNATSRTHGPSWRMVVQLDTDWPVAYGLYPGGQSGNPGSKYYDNMIDRWAAGQLDTLLFMKRVDEQSERLLHRTSLKPKNQ
ncbi:penicillin acylase family protein [Parapedobacter indicus]|uniref:Penicillin amidase n=1 Tax=Parapedobacter indicus TaxID=1477437 RepID=A0A1I3IDG6_9SPHI|nr:penicillin acylase family protein [Parapedobacter indicus]PPL02120.1 penicillin amidase [Parapedobacter indicus]SFI46008.1 penicillin amidase [Parapedobacter indicus]